MNNRAAKLIKGLVAALSTALLITSGGCTWIEVIWEPEQPPENLQIEPSYADALPGTAIQYTLGRWQCCYFFEPVSTRVKWSVEPASEARISATGLLEISNTALAGTELLVHAQGRGGLMLEAKVVLFTAESHPFVGVWTEEKQILCNGQEQVPQYRIEELIFHADGSFLLTWLPFERYHDYWGSYQYDSTTGALSLLIENGNHIPDNADLEGLARIQPDGSIRLEGLSLGTPSGRGNQLVACGHVLQRYGLLGDS